MKRVFLAISFSNNTFISQYINKLKSVLMAEDLRWIESGKSHLTLKYFGPLHAKKAKKLQENLNNCLSNCDSFEIRFDKLGVFGSSYQPKVLWMGMEESKELSQIAEKVFSSIQDLGYMPDSQNFVPHLTLARIKRLESKKYFQSVVDKHKELDSGLIKVDRIYLYESIMMPDGPEYKVLEEYVLNS